LFIRTVCPKVSHKGLPFFKKSLILCYCSSQLPMQDRVFYSPFMYLPCMRGGSEHSSDILSIQFKHTRIIRFFGVFKKYLKILLFEHLRKILVFRMSLLWFREHPILTIAHQWYFFCCPLLATHGCTPNTHGP